MALIGHVCDFMMDDESWAICQLVVKTGHRFTGKEVLIPMSKISRISYEESTVFVNLTMEAVEQSPAHDLSACLCGRTPSNLSIFMKHNKFPPKSKNCQRLTSQSAVRIQTKSEINFTPSPDEVARRAYFSYVNQGSSPGARGATLAGRPRRNCSRNANPPESTVFTTRHKTNFHNNHHKRITFMKTSIAQPRGSTQNV